MGIARSDENFNGELGGCLLSGFTVLKGFLAYVFKNTNVWGSIVEPELRRQLNIDQSYGYLIYFREKANHSPASRLEWGIVAGM